MMKALRLAVLLPVLFALPLLPGCETLGLPKAETFNERSAATLGTITTVRQTATTLLEQKKITADDGQNILTQTDTARAGLDIARNLNKSNPQAADTKLTSVITVLTALQAYLATRSK